MTFPLIVLGVMAAIVGIGALVRGRAGAELLLRRIGWSLVVLWAVGTITFGLVHVVGDPIAMIAGANAKPEDIERIRRERGLDQPLYAQYGRYLGEFVQGDLGYSYYHSQPVTELMAERLPRTALLAVMAIFIELLIGVGVGVVTAVRRNTPFDWAVMGVTLVGISAPTFFTGLLLLEWFGFRFDLFPLGGYGETMAEHVWHAVLPATTLALFGAARYSRLIRGELIEALRADYVRTARAKGAGSVRAVVVHALRNALLPAASLLGVQLAALLGGAIVTETVFAWPGMGLLAKDAVFNVDGPVIMGTVTLGTTLVLTANFLTDLLYTFLDPRIRAE